LCFPRQSLVARQGRSVQKHHGRLSGSSRRYFDRSSGSFDQMARGERAKKGLRWAVTQARYAPARRDSGRADASTGQDMWWRCVRSGPG
jgi:hypothetical protein